MTPPPLFFSCTIAEKVAETELAYYRQADYVVIKADEMLAWYHTLSLVHQKEATLIGIANWKRLSSLKRYSLENRGYKMRLYMATYLTPTELLYWADSLKQRPEGLV